MATARWFAGGCAALNRFTLDIGIILDRERKRPFHRHEQDDEIDPAIEPGIVLFREALDVVSH